MPRLATLVLMLLALGPWGECAAQAFGTLTILEGEALVLRGAGRVHAIEGLRLLPADIFEMESKGFAQIELNDKSRLLIGPNGRVLFNAAGPKQKPELSGYVMGGWFKFVGTSRDAKSNLPALELRSVRFELPFTPGDLVGILVGDQVDLFAETGDIKLIERQSASGAHMIELKQGQHYSRKGADPSVVHAGPQRTLVTEMPRAFRDPLPARAGQFASKEIVAKPAPDFAYADVEAWLKADPAVRRPLVARWRHKARDAAFRNALIANMPAHMEWDRILFPEKYLPKPPPPPPPPPPPFQPR